MILNGVTALSPFVADRNALVRVNMRSVVTATTYFAFIDLDGTGYKHDLSKSAVSLASASAEVLKSSSNAKWVLQLMTVLRISATDSDLGVLQGGLTLQDTATLARSRTDDFFPAFVDLTVIAGGYAKIASGIQENGVTDIKTASTIPNVFGDQITPDVGDVLLRATKLSGSPASELEFTATASYLVR